MAVNAFLKKAQEIQEDLHTRQEEKAHAAEHDESNWLVSYADMMTLLCGFFIMMFSMSTLDAPKYETVKEAVAHYFGGDYKSPNEDMTRFLTNVVQEAGVEAQAVVTGEPTGVAVTFHSTIFFDTLSANVTAHGLAVLRRMMDAIAERQNMENKQYRIIVEGHTDGRPVLSGPYPSNWELSGARASRVVRLFVERGFDPSKLIAIGYGDTRPRMPERTPAGTFDPQAVAQNRRVVLRILEPNADSIPWDQAR